MGGLIIVVLWPMLLPIALLYLLNVALELFAPILLALNLAGLGVLLLVRWLWKRSGTMDRAYRMAQPGWKRGSLTLLRWALGLAILWEGLLVLLFAAIVLGRQELGALL